jgi:hypothetical protein
MRRSLPVLVALAALLGASTARASEPFPDFNVKKPNLRVNAKGQALVEYTTDKGLRRHVIVYGAVNANPPSQTASQVRFKYDFAGGWRIARQQLWKTWKNVCRRYDGPALPYFVAVTRRTRSTWSPSSGPTRRSIGSWPATGSAVPSAS